MLTREDYGNYLKQIDGFEKDMVRFYGTLVGLISDSEVKKLCSHILRQEKKHVELVAELMKLFAVSA